MKPEDFPIGSPRSRAAARMVAERTRGARELLEIISHVPRPLSALPPGTNNSMPHAFPWQEMTDGGLMRIIYCPGEWRKIPVENIPLCSGCGAPFRKTGNQTGGFVCFEADCVSKHISDGSE
jgi:hypothetical protein